MANEAIANALQRWSKDVPVIDWTTAKRVSRGVDYITGVCHEAEQAIFLAPWFKKLYGWEMAGGGVERPWGMSGFSGFKMGQMEFGSFNDMSIVRLESECAKLNWFKVYQAADTITRLDLQLTFNIGFEPHQLIWELFKQAAAHSAKLKRGPKCEVILGADGGATLYCGKRTSNVFGRVYARGPKTKLPEDEHNLRYEVQFNKRLAGLVARRLRAAKDQGDFCDAQVSKFFRSRGLSLEVETRFIPNNCLSRQRSDCDKRLQWLQKAVKPSCTMLRERGKLEELLDALGLRELLGGPE